MASRMGRWLVVAAAALPALVAGCNCDAVLQDAPTPKAVLVKGELRTPPEDHLVVTMATTLVGVPVEATVELRNEGTAPLNVSDIKLSSDPALCPVASGNFVIRDPTASGGRRALELAKGASRTLTVRYTPSSGATDCVVLSVLSDDPEHSAVRALFTGKGDAPALCTQDVLVDFGDLEAGQTADDTVTVQSCGTRAITITMLTTNEQYPPFGLDNVTIPTTLQPGESLTVPVHFHPTTAGLWTTATGLQGYLNFTADSGELYQITLVGRAHMPPSCVLEANPVAVNFGLVPDTTTRTQDVILTNRGDRDCTITDASVQAPQGPFTAAFLGFTAGGTLAPAATATVQVSMTPPAQTGVYNAVLAVTSDDPVRGRIDIPLEVNYPGELPCTFDVNPTTANFGVVPLNTLRAVGISVRNAGSDICFINGVSIEAGSNPGFVNTASSFGLVAAGATKTITVGFRPTQQGQATGRLKIRAADAPFGGATVDYYVQLIARTGTTGICVTPLHLDFGVVATTATKDFTVSACGSQSVTVNALDWTAPDPEFSLVTPLASAVTLQPGDARTFTVNYTPTDAVGDTAVIAVRSDDGVQPAVDVDMTGGPEVVPPSAGRYLYYWQIPGMQGGDVMKFPLQGATQPAPFWGPRTGKACAGCHSISPDGKYVAVIELGTMRFVEADSGLELILGNQFLEPQYFAWRPDVNTTPNYQFAYGTGGVVKVAALFDGFLRDLQGANDSAFLQTMPTWSRTGKIAFVKGIQTANQQSGSGATSFEGPTDIMIVDENGGTSTPLAGASQNTQANYYPQFSPNGLWIAFTQSASAATTFSAADAQIRLVKADGSGTVLQLGNLNGGDGASSYPTWAVDGTYLSFASNRAGGAGDWDIYVAPIDPTTGADGVAQNIADLNTSAFEHGALWSP